MTRKYILIILFFAAFFLRTYLLQQNLFFGPEQGIDFTVVRDLVINHKITLIGSKTYVSGIFHGPVYYYILSIPFLLSSGDPYFSLIFLITFNCLSVIFIYFL